MMGNKYIFSLKDKGTDVTKFEFDTINDINYDSSTGITLSGTADINTGYSVPSAMVIPIVEDDGIAFVEENDLIKVSIDQTTLNKINNSLSKPNSAPSDIVLVGIDTTNTQTQYGLGAGLAIDNSVSPNSIVVNGIKYLTTAPTGNNIDGTLKKVLLPESVEATTTKYLGYEYNFYEEE